MVLQAMPVLEHQQLRRVELVGGDHRGQVFGLVAGKGDEQRVVEQIFGLHVAAGVGEGEEDAVDHAVMKRFARSEEHTSELQSLMRISYAVFCLKKKKTVTRYTLEKIKL